MKYLYVSMVIGCISASSLLASTLNPKLVFTYQYYTFKSKLDTCCELNHQLEGNNQELLIQLVKRNTCFAGKILITNQHLVQQHPECKPALKYRYHIQRKCKHLKYHIRTSIKKLSNLIKANDECGVGEVLLHDLDLISFFPQCVYFSSY